MTADSAWAFLGRGGSQGGEAGARLRALDWTATPFGPVAGWAAPLRLALAACLNAAQPGCVLWGPELRMLGNDALLQAGLTPLPPQPGQPLREVCGAEWPRIGPPFLAALASGQGFAQHGLLLPARGEGQRCWSLSAMPILDEAGAVLGLLAQATETTAQARALEASRAAEERYALALAAGGGLGAWDWDVEANRIRADAGFARMYGVDPARAAAGVPIEDFLQRVHPQDLPRLRAAIARSLASGGELAEEYRLLQAEGPARWVAARGRPHHDAQGRALRFPGVSFDVTARHRAEEALDDSEIRYRALFDAIDEGFCIIEFLDGPHGPLSDYVHVEANAAYSVHAGIPDVVGKRLRELVREEAEDWLARYGGVLHTGQPIRFEQVLEATGRHLELAAFRIEPSSRRQVAVLFQDITARKQAEAALRQLNDTLEARVAQAIAERRILADAVEGSRAFVQVVDMQLRWLAINSAAINEFERVFGARPEVGACVLDLLGDQPENLALIRAVWLRAIAGEEFSETVEFRSPERGRRHYEMHFSPLRDAEGRQIGALQFVYDVTERLEEQERLRRAEAALRQSQKMEAVGQLTGGLAHDFNNLLTGISGSLELLSSRVSQGRYQELERFIGAAQGAARRAAALTHRLLAFSRRQTLDPKPTDANRLVAGMEELVRRTVGPQITLEVVQAAGLWPVLVDPPQLENALLNLCINARDAMPQGGRLTIETGNRWLDPRTARERDLEPGQYISVCVSDTGSGMTPEVIAKAFDPFFTTKPIGQGTGLGLSMIYGFTRQSGGQVRIYSEPGQGAMVCLYLPRHHAAPGETEAEAAPGAVPRAEAGETVLVVDDEPTVRMLVTEVLQELGYAAIEAPDGASGLKILQSDARVDLLITDVGLPGGLNGRQVADAARVVRPGLKVLFITGYAENAVIGNGHLDPGMHVLTKPFNVDVLAARIRGLIAEG